MTPYYMNLWLMIAYNVIGVVICDNIPKIRRHPVLAGTIMGIVSIGCCGISEYLPDMEMYLSIRDVSILYSALLYGPVAAIITTVLSLIASCVMLSFNNTLTMAPVMNYIIGNFSVLAFALMSARYICFRHRPGILLLVILGWFVEVLPYLCLFMLCPWDIVEHFFATVDIESLYKMICGLAVGLVTRPCIFMPKKEVRGNVLVVLAFMSIIFISYSIGIITLERKELQLLDDVAKAERKNIGCGVVPHLLDACTALMSEDGIDGEEPVTVQRLQDLAQKHHLAGITMLDAKCDLLASSRGEADDALLQAFATNRLLALLKDVQGDASECYFHSDYAPDKRELLVAMRYLPQGRGFLFVSMDAAFYYEHFEQFGLPHLENDSDAQYSGTVLLRKSDNKVLCGHSQYAKFIGKELQLPHGMKLPQNDGYVDCRIFGKASSVYVLHVKDYVYLAILPYSAIYLPMVLAYMIIIALFAVICVFVGVQVNAKRKVQQKQEEMQQEVEQRRLQDMATASSIQMSAMPNVFPPSPWDLSLDLYATMHPAWEVGGDFYDYYYLNMSTLVVLMADVSGKGIPAAMFMMRAKSIIMSCIMKESDLAIAMSEANKLLCQDNVAEMFITCWVGLLHTDNGQLEYVNAGHNAPYVRHADGSLTSLSEVSGLFLAGLDDSSYTRFETTLGVGDMLFLYTDGVTEANDKEKAMFGEERLEQTLKDFDPQAPEALEHGQPCMLCSNVNKAVCAFMGQEPQFDDMTMLTLLYRGQPKRVRLAVPATVQSGEKVTAFLETALKRFNCPDDICMEMLVAMDEIFSNVAQYSGSTTFQLDIMGIEGQKVVNMVCSDNGKPYNPLAAPAPDLTLRDDDRPIGGLGIYVVKNLLDDLYYVYLDGKNVLHLRKRF